MSSAMQAIASGNFKLKKTKIETKPKEVKIREQDKSLMEQILSQGKKLVSSKLKRKNKTAPVQVTQLGDLVFVSPKAREDAITKQIEENKASAARLRKEKEVEWAAKAKQIEAEAEIEKARRAAEAAKLIREQKGQTQRRLEETRILSGIDHELHQNIVSSLRSEIEELKRTVSSLSLNKDERLAKGLDSELVSLASSSRASSIVDIDRQDQTTDTSDIELQVIEPADNHSIQESVVRDETINLASSATLGDTSSNY